MNTQQKGVRDAKRKVYRVFIFCYFGSKVRTLTKIDYKRICKVLKVWHSMTGYRYIMGW